MTPNRPVSVDRLIDALWSDDPPAAASNALQYHVSQLRKVLGDGASIVTQEPGYLIRVDSDQLDLLRFERLVTEAERDGRPREAAGCSARRSALAGRGPRRARRTTCSRSRKLQRLEAARLAALERRIDADLALGRHAQLVPELEALVRTHPLHEGLVGALMRALYGAGRQAEALEVYRATRERFDSGARDRAVAVPPRPSARSCAGPGARGRAPPGGRLRSISCSSATREGSTTCSRLPKLSQPARAVS